MRIVIAALAVLTLSACEQAAEVAPTTLATGEECYLNASYVSGNELSQRVWQHIQTQQYNLTNSEGAAFGAAQWYSRRDGRAGFVYHSNCQEARGHVEAVLEDFAQSAPSADVAQALRDAKETVREITQAQFEDSEPL